MIGFYYYQNMITEKNADEEEHTARLGVCRICHGPLVPFSLNSTFEIMPSGSYPSALRKYLYIYKVINRSMFDRLFTYGSTSLNDQPVHPARAQLS